MSIQRNINLYFKHNAREAKNIQIIFFCIFTNLHDEECNTAGRPIYLLVKCNVQNNIIFTNVVKSHPFYKVHSDVIVIYFILAALRSKKLFFLAICCEEISIKERNRDKTGTFCGISVS